MPDKLIVTDVRDRDGRGNGRNAVAAMIASTPTSDRKPAPRRRTLRADRHAGMTVLLAVSMSAIAVVSVASVMWAKIIVQGQTHRNAGQMAANALASAVFHGGLSAAGNVQTIAKAIFKGQSTSVAGPAILSSANLGTLASNGAFTVLPSGSGTMPNAVQVTAQQSLPAGVAGFLGLSSSTIDTTTTVSLGAQTYNVFILNDVAQGFDAAPSTPTTPNLTQQQAANQAILNCLHNTGNASAQFGFVGFTVNVYTGQNPVDGPATSYTNYTAAGLTGANETYQRLSNVSTNYTALSNAATGAYNSTTNPRALVKCGGGLAKITPACNKGSNVASALYVAQQAFSGAAYAGATNIVLIITDELPTVDPTTGVSATNYGSVTLTELVGGKSVAVPTATPAWGSYVTVSGGKGTGSGSAALCTTGCTSANLIQMAEGQAAAAGSAGLVVSTVFFNNDSTAGSQPGGPSAAYTEIQSWVKNGGFSANVSTDTGIPTAAANVCKMIAAGIKQISS